MPSLYLHNADYWRKQAAKLRELAETASPSAREHLVRLARDYELIAQRPQRPEGTRTPE
jgi:hypothetical protein